MHFDRDVLSIELYCIQYLWIVDARSKQSAITSVINIHHSILLGLTSAWTMGSDRPVEAASSQGDMEVAMGGRRQGSRGRGSACQPFSWG